MFKSLNNCRKTNPVFFLISVAICVCLDAYPILIRFKINVPWALLPPVSSDKNVDSQDPRERNGGLTVSSHGNNTKVPLL